MIRPSKKEPCEIMPDNLAPPYQDDGYFANADQLLLRYESQAFDMVNAWWLIEAATLVYADEDFVNVKFNRTSAGF